MGCSCVQPADGVHTLRKNVDTCIAVPNDMRNCNSSSGGQDAKMLSVEDKQNSWTVTDVQWYAAGIVLADAPRPRQPPAYRTRLTQIRFGHRLLDVVGNNTPLQDAFLLADDVLRQVRCQSSLL
jgi:hypothetical protein